MKKRHCFKKKYTKSYVLSFWPKNLDLNVTFQVVGGVGGGGEGGGARLVLPWLSWCVLSCLE